MMSPVVGLVGEILYPYPPPWSTIPGNGHMIKRWDIHWHNRSQHSLPTYAASGSNGNQSNCWNKSGAANGGG